MSACKRCGVDMGHGLTEMCAACRNAQMMGEDDDAERENRREDKA